MGMGNGTRPPMLTAAAVVLAAEAAALLVYTVMNVVAIATGNSYQASSGAGLVVMQLIMMAFLLWLAVGVLKLRPWTRTPSVMVQVLIAVVAIFLLEAHQYAWGALTLVLAVAGLAGFLTPASLKALARPIDR